MQGRDLIAIGISGCLALAGATPVSADVLKPDLQHAFLVSILAALPAVRASTDAPMDLAVSVGYREDNLDWNIAGNGVNVLSELTWKNMVIAHTQVAARFNFKHDWQVHTELGYGAITSGANQDSDYNGNNRALEFSRSNNKTGGNVADASIGIGKTLRLLDQTVGKFIYITPFAGLSVHQQNLTLTDGVQTIPALGPLTGLNSSYDAQWQGPWIGVDALIETGHSVSLVASAEYHWASYTAQANWNLRDDLAHPVSFKHTAKGQGVVLSGGVSYLVTQDWTVNVTLKHRKWTTRAGSDWTYLADGSTGFTRFNAANWDSTAYNIEIVHRF